MVILKNNKVKMAVICRNVRKFAPKFEFAYPMKRILQTFCGLFVLSLALTSCLGSDDDTTTYDDMVIKTFKLGTLNRYLHTKTKDGRDSVYKVSYSASTYKMNIDQINDTIYNADSLAIGTDIAHVICTVTTKNNGAIFLKSMTSDSLSYFNSGSDSVDFTKPRIFRVFSTDGSGYRDYKVSLTVRQMKKDVFMWTTADISEFPEDHTHDNIRKAAEAAGLTYLGCTYVEAYAMSPDGCLMESEDLGETWKKDRLDSDHALLPTTSLAFVSWELDILTDYALLVGQNPARSSAMTLWRKLADYDMEGQWVYMPWAEDNRYYLPRMDYVALAYFKNMVFAFGSDRNVYVSRDQGITWKTSSNYSYPTDFNATTGYQVAVSDDDTLWLKDPASGKAWQGILSE